MKILFIGDVFGKTGRQVLSRYLPQVKKKYNVDMVIANGENVSHGKGLIRKHYDEMVFEGISLITLMQKENYLIISMMLID